MIRKYTPFIYLMMILSLLINLKINCADVDTIFIYSTKMQKDIPAIIISPDSQYDSDLRFPAIYLLHGFSDNYRTWYDRTNLEALADQYKVIIVCPDGSPNSWYLDSPIDSKSQYETFIIKELIEWVDNNYPTIRDKNGRAITGISMGGHGSLYLAIKNPEFFIATSSLSGLLNLHNTTQKSELSKKIGDEEKYNEYWIKNSVLTLIDSLKNGDLNILIDCGVDDFFIEDNRLAHQKLLELNIDHEYYERPGGHSWDYWERTIEYHFLFFKKCFY